MAYRSSFEKPTHNYLKAKDNNEIFYRHEAISISIDVRPLTFLYSVFDFK